MCWCLLETLRHRVNQRLGREDVTAANLRVAFAQIPWTVIRRTVFREIAAGALHPKEEVVVAEVFAMGEHGEGRGKGTGAAWTARARPARAGEVAVARPEGAAANGTACGDTDNARRAGGLDGWANFGQGGWSAERASAAGLEVIGDRPDEAMMPKMQAERVEPLLTPQVALSEIPESVVQMVKAMPLYFAGASLSRLGRWFDGKAKSPMSTWVMGLAVALWPVIPSGGGAHVKGKRLSIDEKWLKIRKHWHDLFVAVAHDSGLPVFHDLLPTRTTWACRLFLVKLKRLGQIPTVMITDGVQGYVSALANVFPAATPLLCLFHHQQGVTRCVTKPFGETDQEEAHVAKKQMKRVVQTPDPRTVHRRVDRLEHTAREHGWKMLDWITRTRDHLPHLLPSLRSKTFPSTTKDIERFFRGWVRFSKPRGGFHSGRSAKREIIFFMVVDLFTIQDETDQAPLEKILPEAATMPFYRLLNSPFARARVWPPPQDVKPIEKMATEPVEAAAGLP